MMVYKKILISSILLIILSVIMFIVGVSFFAYTGNQLNPIIIKLGEISFAFWLPALILGIILFFISIILAVIKKPK
ncbi:hypothetical protein SAMN05444409_0492 [Epilithonimonas zeae]|uniref:DUF3955 domain-containing protein n=1 Tax=Epilithonimonas zeae TaxID=1416779 RepID=A0A1N6ECT8_9FLAO|nr:hypothetical protein SAMN05444409_0492 [Epilithonimonas zeae]